MTNYIINFGVYTMAMIGFITLAACVYKKTNTLGFSSKSSLKIDDKIALNARKSLYVVNAGGERFLIAGDIDNTSLIAKLGQDKVTEINETMTSLLVENKEEKKEKSSDLAELDFNKVVPKKERSFISHETANMTLPKFETEFSDAQKSLDNAFEKVNYSRNGKYLDVKNIRKKPVMKELARKLAQI